MPYRPRADRTRGLSGTELLQIGINQSKMILAQNYFRCYKKSVTVATDLSKYHVRGKIMLMRTDPFRDLDRLAQQVLGTAARPAVMPVDAWREGEQFIVEFDLPGVDEDSLDL